MNDSSSTPPAPDVPEEVPAEAHEVGGRLLRSSGAATISQVWRFGVTFGTQMILRRLVAPEGWGMWHWAVDFLFLLLAQVRDLGLPAQVVRDRDRPYGALFFVELVWGGLLAVVVFLAAPLLARAYDPGVDVVPILQALCLFFVIEGLGKVPLTYFEAEILVDRALFPEIMRNFVYASTAILLAWMGLDIWALVIAHILAASIFTLMLWKRAWGLMDLSLDRAALPQLVRASLPLMLMAFVLLAVEWVDVQIGGLVMSSGEVGIYGGALFLAMLIVRVLEWPLRRALYPSFVAVQDDPERFFETYRLATLILMAVQVPFALGLYFNAEILLTTIFSEAYAPAADFLRLLCFVPLVQPFARCAEDVILTRHEERILIWAAIVNLLVIIVVGSYLGLLWGGTGVAASKLMPIGSLLVTWAMWRVHPRGFWRLCLHLLAVYGVGAICYGVAVFLAPTPGWTRLLLSFLAGGASLGICWTIWGKSVRRFFAAR